MMAKGHKVLVPRLLQKLQKAHTYVCTVLSGQEEKENVLRISGPNFSTFWPATFPPPPRAAVVVETEKEERTPWQAIYCAY